MRPAVFFHSPEVAQVLSRAVRCAAMPLSVHCVEGEEEGPKILSFGQCAACRYVADLPGGMAFCRNSRLPASIAALRRGKPVPFVCHMGFACVSVRTLPDSGFTLTLGPYYPDEAPQTLERDARAGLAALDHEVEGGSPVSLSDIRLVSADAVPELAAWTAESLRHLWEAREDAALELLEVPEAGDRKVVSRGKGKFPSPDPYQAADIAAALAGGNQEQARALVHAVLSECLSGQRVRSAVRRARAVALAAAVLEASARAQIDITGCWDRFAEFLTDVQRAHTDQSLCKAVIRMLGIVKKRASRGAAAGNTLKKLNRILISRLDEHLTLRDVAEELGQEPSTITRRLQRRFGMSFSQYVGRLRVDKAKDLLSRTRLRSAEVARRVGIGDAGDFRRLFRKFEGMSPRDYRDRFGKGA